MARRSRAREVALQLLFQRDQNPKPVPRPALERFARARLLGDAEMAAYCLALYDGTLKHQAEIDPKLTATATNWRLSRMHPADRNVLRLAAYELLFDPAGQPVEVVLNEAIELARRFGSKDSAAFVNGVLDKIARMKSEKGKVQNEEPVTPAPEPSPKPEPPKADTANPINQPSVVSNPVAPSPPPGLSLRHRIAYHNTERMGRPLVDGDALGVKTSKETRSWRGDVVWFIQGDGEDQRHYSLASVFVVDEVGATGEEELSWFARGKHGHIFEPHIPLNQLAWFPAFRHLMGNFGICPQTLTDQDVLRELLQLAARAGFNPTA